MSDQPTGDRFRLLLYERRIKRFRQPALTLTLLLWVLWYLVKENYLEWPPPPNAPWLMAGGLVASIFWLFTLIAPRMAYAQPHADHLRLQTPIYRLKISYRRIHNTRPIDFAKTFPPSRVRRSDRWLLQPFFGATALGVDVTDWPLKPSVLRLFFNRYFFAPDQPSFVLLVQDWMALSNQLSSKMDAWRGKDRERPRGPGIDVADILRED
jgi:hypothetical protein